MRILVVDDHPDYTTLMVDLLRSQISADIEAASSGKAALQAMRKSVFDLVICDYQMPEMSGHEVFQAMQAEGLTCSFLLFTNFHLGGLPKFEGPGYLGVIRKTEFEKLVHRVTSMMKVVGD